MDNSLNLIIMNLFRKNKKKQSEINIFQGAALKKQENELLKKPLRTEIINFLLLQTSRKRYLEIGTRNPDDNFNKIVANLKKSVDPCVEYETEDIDYKLTSDEFFKLHCIDSYLVKCKWDVIFIDGLHLAEQVYKDIINSFEVLSDDGFIILHDCNPPSVYHARENYIDYSTIAKGYWNGTVWKGFCKARMLDGINSVCIDSDWGVGILTRRKIDNFRQLDTGTFNNQFYEFDIFDNNRTEILNLIDFKTLKNSF